MIGVAWLPDTADRPAAVLTVQSDATIASAAALMRDRRVGCLPVTDAKGRIVGILTERDIVGRAVASPRDPHAALVADIMTSDVTICPPGTSIAGAREIMMARSIRHLPVVQDGKPIAVISSRDLMAYELTNDKAKRAAAEQIAKLSTCLKTIDFDEVVNVIVQEVPKVFEAQRCVLCFCEDQAHGGSQVRVHRHDCPCPNEDLYQRRSRQTASGAAEVRVGDPPDVCREHQARSVCVNFPLRLLVGKNARGQPPAPPAGFLCMCDISDGGPGPDELISYKTVLVREILDSNLTNASLYRAAKLGSLTDALTGAGTRRLFEEKLEAECRRAKRYGRPFCVAIMDLDRFKLINDKLGHSAGDEALRKVAAIIEGAKRGTDVVARYGGDEFVLLLPETKTKGAMTLLERIRAQVEEIPMPKDLTTSISCGVVERSDSDDSGNEILRRADIALYEAKDRGRNRIITWKQIASRDQDGSFFESQKIKELQGRLTGMSMQSKEMFLQSIGGLVQALEARDPYTKCHSENVMRYAVGIAESMKTSPDEIKLIRRAAIVHDIGKIGVPDAILRKPGKLTPQERAIMEQHPLIAVRILDQMRFLEREMVIIRHHHERWDGRGYPDGLSRAQIPPGARILCVADAFDAITSDRVYHESRSLPEAMQVLNDGAGQQFDPDVVKAMTEWVERVGRALRKTEAITPEELLASQSACTIAA